MDMRGKTAVVTGGAVRVGKAISLMLAQHGANVVVNYHSSAAEAEITVAEAQAYGVDAVAIQADVSDLDSVNRLAAAVGARFGGVDILVNNAGYFGRTRIPTDDIATWQRVTRISIDGAFYMANSLVPSMRTRGGGVIVNIVDLSAWTPWRGFTAHAVGKAGLLALTRQLALELAPAIRVNAVTPGPVLPPLDYSPARVAAVARKTLLDRWGEAADVALAVRYLIEADYVTGEILTVDGGERLAQYKYDHPAAALPD